MSAYALCVGNPHVVTEVVVLGAVDAADVAVLAGAGVGALVSSPAAVGVCSVDGALPRWSISNGISSLLFGRGP